MVKIIDWVPLDPKIKQWHGQGKSPYFMSKELGLSRETLVKHMEQSLGLVTKKNGPRTPIQWVSNDEIRCKACSEVKPKEEFYTQRTNPYQNYSGKCKKCISDQEKSRYHESEFSWRKKQYDVKLSAQRRNISFDLPEDYLQSLFTIQEGLCAYTQQPILTVVGQGHIPQALSVDRFDTSVGYVVGNIVLVTRRANSIKLDQSLVEFKEWMPLWYAEGSKALHKNISHYPLVEHASTPTL